MEGGMSNQISNWAGGGATTTLGAAQLIYGMYLDSKNKRPDYNIPAEISQNLSDAQMMALQGLPEEQKQQFISNLQRGQAYGMSQLGTRKAGLQGVAALNQQGNDAYSNMLAQDSAQRMVNKQLLMQQRGIMADYRDQQFQINQLNPYYEKKSEAQALQGAGMQNMSQGFQAGNSGNVDWGGGSGGGRSMSDGGDASQQFDGMNEFQIQQNEGLVNPYRSSSSYNSGLTNPYRK